MNCPVCGVAITEKNLAAAYRISGCPKCGAELDFEDGKSKKVKAKAFAQTGDISVERDDHTVRFAFKGSPLVQREEFKGAVGMAGLWLAIYVWLHFAAGNADLASTIKNMVMFCFWFTVYFSLANGFNRKELLLDPQYLKFKQSPVPMPGNRSIKRDEVEMVDVRREFENSSKRRLQFNLYAHLKNGKNVLLMPDQPNRDTAYYIAQELNRHLHENDATFEDNENFNYVQPEALSLRSKK